MWVIIVIAVILILKSVMTSHNASTLRTQSVPVASGCGGVGDSFFGPTTVAGVPEPCTGFHTPLIPGVPCHVRFPVDPPPIAIQTVKLPATSSVKPISRPVTNYRLTPRCITGCIGPTGTMFSGGGGYTGFCTGRRFESL
jgi:hypothetical protein